LSLLHLFYINRPWAYRKAMILVVKFWTLRSLNLIGIHVHQKGQTVQSSENFLVVSNHLSYLDILLITSQFPSCFVTSMEIKETPFLGYITELGGCLYVERRSKENLHQEIQQITVALEKGFNVTIFPEATSTNGEKVLRFRRPLYQAAISSKKPVLPICLNYKFLNYQKVNKANRDTLFWYGDMNFLSHLWQLMGQESIHVEIELLPSLPIIEVVDTQILAEKSHNLVSHSFIPVT
ncbi:MAG: 1-acyl-sn-glycerol-3-phosphate acyltransferase, partial [Bdellovibrionales bacterium]|nr:1-acyl-sn-glycerol-3-phosphate acyltransferase [Bdellovibrionales bacterium]